MKKKLKILFLAPGSSTHSFKWINFFSKRYNIYWFHESDLKFKIKNIKSYKLKNGFKFIFQPIIFLIKVFLIKPDLIHIHSISKNLFFSFLVMIFYKKKVILNPWGSDIFFPNLIVSVMQRFIKNNILFTDSFIIRNKFKKNNKVYKINFGVDLHFFNKKKDYIFKKKKIIFCPRGYDPIYNQSLILRFINENKKKLDNFLFVFSGTVHDEQYLFFKEFINKNKLNRLIRLKTYLEKNLYKEYLLKAFLVISASKSDAGLSSSIAEAMSSKCLVLCSNNRDNPYWIKNNFNGFLFKDNDQKNFKKKFFYIIKLKKNKIIKITKKARETQFNKNNFFLEMKKVENLYKNLSDN